MASNPPGRCCFEGVKHEGTVIGAIQTVGGVRTYVTYPEDKNTQNAIIVFTDALGMDSINVQLIADQFAADGYFVVIPDFFNGDQVPLVKPPGWDFNVWLQTKMPRVPACDPICEATIRELRDIYGVKRIGGVGYCFGGKYVCRWLKEGALDAGFTAHPSFVDNEEVLGVRGPLSIAAAETDEILTTPKRHETEALLQSIPSKPAYQINLFSHVEHGFAVRCDLSDKRQKFAKEQAFMQALAWFDEYVKE